MWTVRAIRKSVSASFLRAATTAPPYLGLPGIAIRGQLRDPWLRPAQLGEQPDPLLPSHSVIRPLRMVTWDPGAHRPRIRASLGWNHDPSTASSVSAVEPDIPIQAAQDEISDEWSYPYGSAASAPSPHGGSRSPSLENSSVSITKALGSRPSRALKPGAPAAPLPA